MDLELRVPVAAALKPQRLKLVVADTDRDVRDLDVTPQIARLFAAVDRQSLRKSQPKPTVAALTVCWAPSTPMNDP